MTIKESHDIEHVIFSRPFTLMHSAIKAPSTATSSRIRTLQLLAMFLENFSGICFCFFRHVWIMKRPIPSIIYPLSTGTSGDVRFVSSNHSMIVLLSSFMGVRVGVGMMRMIMIMPMSVGVSMMVVRVIMSMRMRRRKTLRLSSFLENLSSVFFGLFGSIGVGEGSDNQQEAVRSPKRWEKANKEDH